MTTVETINPDGVVLQQLEGYWKKIALMILWKSKGREPVRITADDMRALAAEFQPDGPVLFTHGMGGAMEFSIVDRAAALRIAEHDRMQAGHA